MIKKQELLTLLIVVVLLFFVPLSGAVPTEIDVCGTLSIDGGNYILNKSVSSTGTCFTIGASNITLDGAGWNVTSTSLNNYGIDVVSFNNITIKNFKSILSGPDGEAIRLYTSNNNTVTNNTLTMSRMRLYASSNNNITNNNLTGDVLLSGGGFYLTYASNNNRIVGGSIYIDNIGNGASLTDYLLIGVNNNTFVNTNFTIRAVKFYDNSSWFNYSDNNITYISNNVSILPYTYAVINRTINNWNQTNLTWSEISTNGVVFPLVTEIPYYNITGLLPSTNYSININSTLQEISTTDASGKLPLFSVVLTTNAQTTISVLQYNYVPTVPVLYTHTNFHLLSSSEQVNWTASTDNESDGIGYDVKVYNTSTGLIIVNQTNITFTNSTNFTTLNWTNYNYTARACDVFGCSDWETVNTFGFTNAVPVVINITLLPTLPTYVSNLTVLINSSDTDGDTLTDHFRWYKNGVLNTSWNDSTYLNYTNNFTTDDYIYVTGWVSDGYNNSSELTSSTVSINSSNSAPNLPGIEINKSMAKYGKTVFVNTTNPVTDLESYFVQLQVYYYNASDKVFLVNSSWVAPSSNFSLNFSNPWSDGLSHNIYAQAMDSGNITNQSNLMSSESQIIFTSDVTPPNVSSYSVSATSITAGGSVTISVVTNVSNGTTASASVRVTRPDASVQNWTMTTTDNTNWSKIYTTTSDTGLYEIINFYITDDSGNVRNNVSSLSFTASAATIVVGGGGGSGGGGYIITPTPVPTTSVFAPLTLLYQNATDIKNEASLEAIGNCLSQSLLLNNECSKSAITLTEAINWWILLGAPIASLLVIFILSIVSGKSRNFLMDTVLYSVIAIISVLLLMLSGFNVWVLSYVFSSNLPGLMFASMAVWASFVTVIGDNFQYREIVSKSFNQTVKKIKPLR
ncbi:MAG: hypothetical protein OIN86_12965 [Candidatus Methanoperedens sp.]|nr:hypothetical protein [Candidatus Methanoperedens sp.]CAG0948674.1 hypothetical protein METP1_00047 [Methanosarcinales archaeon]